MPTKRKEILVSTIDSLDTTPPQESLVTDATKITKPVSPRRKTSTPKTAKESKAIREQELTTQLIESTESVESTLTERPQSSTEVELEFTSTEEAMPQAVQDKISKKKRKETYSKEKFFVRNDLLKKIKALTKINDKNFKTNFINDAIEKSLNEREATKE